MSKNVCGICGSNYEYVAGRWRCPACDVYKPEEFSNEEDTLLYNAEQKLRLANFDDAEIAFDDIVRKYPKNPAGYWGRLRASYGIKEEVDLLKTITDSLVKNGVDDKVKIDFSVINRVDGIIEPDTVLQIAANTVFGSKKDLHFIFHSQQISSGVTLPVDSRRIGHQTGAAVPQSIFNSLNIINTVQNLVCHKKIPSKKSSHSLHIFKVYSKNSISARVIMSNKQDFSTKTNFFPMSG